MAIQILSVTPHSPAARAGICSGDFLEMINNEPVLDEVDYQSLSAVSRLTLTVCDHLGNPRTIPIFKSDWEPLGLCLDETKAMEPRHCRNHCLFCFVDQLPSGMRQSLYVKDDDWRLSLMMGNYVTLTNVNDEEFSRIIRRKASPLYISVHATDPDIRIRLLRNPNAGNIMERLTLLKDNDIQFHGQVVLCPGYNDGDVLRKTIDDFASLFPAARSLAIVPIGITSHRNALHPMNPVTPRIAEQVIGMTLEYQTRFLNKMETRFVYPSDEFFCLAGIPLPDDKEYEDYPQIENGVGMLRLLESECEAADKMYPENAVHSDPCGFPVRIIIPTGVSARPFIEKLAEKYKPSWSSVEVVAVPNRFFGETITVTGLIVGRDLVNALSNYQFDRVLISETMLRENSESFLDDMTLDEVRNKIGKPVIVVQNNGEAFIRALRNPEVDYE